MDPLAGREFPTGLLGSYMATQVEIIQSKAVARGVVDALKLTESPSTKEAFISATEGQGDIRDWLADLLLRGLAVIPARESGVITISFAGADPQFAAAVANAFADEYQKAAVRLKVEPLKQASIYFSEQSRSLRDKLGIGAAGLSVASRRLAPQDPRLTGREGTMLLNAAYLVATEGEASTVWAPTPRRGHLGQAAPPRQPAPNRSMAVAAVFPETTWARRPSMSRSAPMRCPVISS